MLGPVIVDAVATQPHYLDHLLPIWEALPIEARGYLSIPEPLRAGIDVGTDGPRGDIVLVASWGDAQTCRMWRKVALMEHGVGQTYRESGVVAHAAYAGADRCDRIDLFLCPNQRVADLNRTACPTARIEMIGDPHLDRLQHTVVRNPVFDVGFTWHWDLKFGPDKPHVPELQCTFDWWKPAVQRVAERWGVLGSAHPRAQASLFPRYRRMEVPTEAAFNRFVGSIKVLVCDNSSAMFYAAALGVPVVILNHPEYRRDVDHGLRFWEYADIGPQIGHLGDLPGVTADVLADPARWATRAHEVCAELFPMRDGLSAQRAASILANG